MGCGPSSGCAEVLNSRWSTWLGIPAGAIGALDYLVMFAATLFVGAGRSASVRGRAWAVLVVTAVAAAGAAIWFVFLQFEVLGDWCKYCLTVHACGLVAAGLVFWRVPAVLRGTRPSVHWFSGNCWFRQSPIRSRPAGGRLRRPAPRSPDRARDRDGILRMAR